VVSPVMGYASRHPLVTSELVGIFLALRTTTVSLSTAPGWWPIDTSRSPPPRVRLDAAGALFCRPIWFNTVIITSLSSLSPSSYNWRKHTDARLLNPQTIWMHGKKFQTYAFRSRYATARLSLWIVGAASRHATAPNSHTKPSLRSL